MLTKEALGTENIWSISREESYRNHDLVRFSELLSAKISGTEYFLKRYSSRKLIDKPLSSLDFNEHLEVCKIIEKLFDRANSKKTLLKYS